ncbi:(2Fe-2S)-binding protein [candidate division KSB1 bacterium]|nr:(2Fe-2S)-binding protein [candidate division KSB1 bacterium]
MPNIKIDGIEFESPKGWTILEVAKFLGLEIPTLCYDEGLTAWGACRLCVVEIGDKKNSKLVTSCTYKVEEGLNIRTASNRVVQARKVLIELLVASCPTSKTIQDLASKFGVQKVRFKPDWEDCIYCGLCVRICEEQMDAKAIGFTERGGKLQITTPFDKKSDVCRLCGACMYICPVCELRCEGPNPQKVLCGGCYNSLQPSCLENYDDYMCYEGLKGDCGTCIREKPEEIKKQGE